MSNRQNLMRWFNEHPNEWVAVDSLRELGGEDTTRRIRELRDAGMPIENRRRPDGTAEYRVRVLAGPHASPVPDEDRVTVFAYPCPKCGRQVAFYRTFDERFRTGRCAKDGPVEVRI